MNPKLMICISVALSALAQVFLKRGLTNLRLRWDGNRDREVSGLLGVVIAVVRQEFIWLWGICFVVAMGLWLAGLQKLDLSYAYPLVSLGYVLVTILSAIFFRERVNGNRWLAVGVICVGVMLIAGS
jgi:undecaprenyl phosphate-alpha-L-ara4N flippase subunit ArnE